MYLRSAGHLSGNTGKKFIYQLGCEASWVNIVLSHCLLALSRKLRFYKSGPTQLKTLNQAKNISVVLLTFLVLTVFMKLSSLFYGFLVRTVMKLSSQFYGFLVRTVFMKLTSQFYCFLVRNVFMKLSSLFYGFLVRTVFMKLCSHFYCFLVQTLSIYKFALSVCLYPINVKTAEPIGPKFFVVPHVTMQGRLMNDQNFKYLSPSKFDLH